MFYSAWLKIKWYPDCECNLVVLVGECIQGVTVGLISTCPVTALKKN